MIGIILAHGKAIETIKRNMNTWSAWCTDYEYICPSDDPLVGFDNVYTSGLSKHNGHDTVERMRYACERAANHKKACVLEYDTLIFDSPPVIKGNVLYGCGPFYDSNPRFKADWWSHSPWLTSQKNFKKLSACPTDELETHFPDRWIAAAADYCGIKASAYKLWWSQNSIDTPQFEIESLVARKDGAIAIHGVKTERVYDILMSK
jgi:hypothetical protein